MKPTVGRIVIYKSNVNNGPGNDVVSPAIITRTKDTTVKAVIDRWGPSPHEVATEDGGTFVTAPKPSGVVEDLPDDDTVDLAVFGLGQTYREFGIKRGDGRGEWQWPERV